MLGNGQCGGEDGYHLAPTCHTTIRLGGVAMKEVVRGARDEGE